jgi:antiviral helicase SKI2
LQDIANEQDLLAKIDNLRVTTSDDLYESLPDLSLRISLLEHLGYIESGTQAVTLKGRVACECNTMDELLITELLFGGFFELLEPSDIPALLSTFVFQEKSNDFLPDSKDSSQTGPSYVPYSPAFLTAQKKLEKAWNDIIAIQCQFGLSQLPFGCSEDLCPGCQYVVYQWSHGLSFSDIVACTDILEGTVVRTILRVDEACRDLGNAAKLMGNQALASKMEIASSLIKRDICFAASLYLD